MNETQFSSDDPKLTAYALGELDADERAAIETALRDDPAARAIIDATRAFGAQLETALATEASPTTQPALSGPAAIPRSVRSNLFRFPRLYFVIGGLAAACFALLVVWNDRSTDRREPMSRPRAGCAQETSAAREQAIRDALSAHSKVQRPAITESSREAAAAPVPLVSTPASAPAPAVTMAASPSSSPAVNIAPISSTPVPPLALKPAMLSSEQSFKDALAAQPPASLPPPPDHIDPFAGDNPSFGGFTRSAEVTLGATTSTNRATSTLAGTRLPDFGEGKWQAASRVGGTDGRKLGEINVVRGRIPHTADSESYAYRPENNFVSAATDPVSTFSADVDTASYANVRRFIQNGQHPPVDAVRIEELLNSFTYHYPPPNLIEGAAHNPKDDSWEPPINASLEIAEAPWATSHRLVRIGLKARDVSVTERGAANLVFLLDVSGSMAEPNKLPLVKDSMHRLLGRLRPDDHVAIVTYAGETGLALASTPVAKASEIEAALDRLQAEGSTNGGMGIQLAYDVAKAHFVAGGVNRVILCTDGDFNVGLTSEGDLVRLIKAKARSGVFLTVLGFGMGNYKDAMLQKLADAGNGNYGYIDTSAEAQKLLVEGLSGTLVTVAKDVKLRVEFNPARVARYRLIGYEKRALARSDFNNDRVDAGEMGAGHSVTALYEIVPAGAADAAGPDNPPAEPMRYGPPPGGWNTDPNHVAAVSDELLTLKIRYKEPSGDVSRKLEFPLIDRGAKFAAASADFKFAAAVAGFGLILRDSPYKGTATLTDVANWANAGIADDPGGHRSEFVDLVKQTEALK